MTYPPRMADVPDWARWNCATYALWVWATWGGYLLIRRSQIADLYALGRGHLMSWVPHLLAQPYGRPITHLGPSWQQREQDSARHWLVFWWRLWRIPDPRIYVGDAQVMGERCRHIPTLTVAQP